MTNRRRQHYVERFHIMEPKKQRNLMNTLMDQLDACTTDEARRLLLGKSEQFAPGEYVEASPQLGEEKAGLGSPRSKAFLNRSTSAAQKMNG